MWKLCNLTCGCEEPISDSPPPKIPPNSLWTAPCASRSQETVSTGRARVERLIAQVGRVSLVFAQFDPPRFRAFHGFPQLPTCHMSHLTVI